MEKAEIGPYPNNWAKGLMKNGRRGEYRTYRGSHVRVDGKDPELGLFGYENAAGQWVEVIPGPSVTRAMADDDHNMDALYSGVWVEAYHWTVPEDPPYVYTYDGHEV